MHSKWGGVGGREMGDKGSSAAKEISISIDFFPGDKVGVKKKTVALVSHNLPQRR